MNTDLYIASKQQGSANYISDKNINRNWVGFRNYNPDTGADEKFDPAYGAGDRYYGWMNIVKWSNLDDREIMVELYPLKDKRLELKYNIFNIIRPEGEKINGNLQLPPWEKHLGDEFDLFVKYDYNEHWQFVTALGYFILKDARIADINNPGDAFWISLQVLYNFNLKLV